MYIKKPLCGATVQIVGGYDSSSSFVPSLPFNFAVLL